MTQREVVDPYAPPAAVSEAPTSTRRRQGALWTKLYGGLLCAGGALLGVTAAVDPPGPVARALFVAALAAVSWADWGVRGVWAALTVLIVTRLVLMGERFRRRRWLVTGFG